MTVFKLQQRFFEFIGNGIALWEPPLTVTGNFCSDQNPVPVVYNRGGWVIEKLFGQAKPKGNKGKNQKCVKYDFTFFIKFGFFLCIQILMIAIF